MKVCSVAAWLGRKFTFIKSAGSVVAALLAVSFISPTTSSASDVSDLLTQGRVDEALQILERKIRTAPTAQDYDLECRAHFELDSWDSGIPECEKAVALEPNSGLYHLWLGRIYGEKADRVVFFRAMGLAGKVRHEFERAVELSPESWEARTDLAEFYLEAPGVVGGGEDKARAQADALMPLNPGMAHWVRARIAQKNKDDVTAEKEYRAEIEASHGMRAWVNLAGFYRHRNRIDDMVTALRTMETQPLDRPAALMDGAGLLLRSDRELAMAVRLARRYLASSTAEEWPAFKAHAMLGELLEKQGDRQGAVEEYKTALSMAHNFKRAQDALKRIQH